MKLLIALHLLITNFPRVRPGNVIYARWYNIKVLFTRFDSICRRTFGVIVHLCRGEHFFVCFFKITTTKEVSFSEGKKELFIERNIQIKKKITGKRDEKC